MTTYYRLAAKAFDHVLRRKQSQYGQVLAWLRVTAQASAPTSGKEALMLGRVVRDGEAAFHGYKY